MSSFLYVNGRVGINKNIEPQKDGHVWYLEPESKNIN